MATTGSPDDAGLLDVVTVVPPFAANAGEDFELFGYSLEETRRFAGTCLMRRLKLIGLS